MELSRNCSWKGSPGGVSATVKRTAEGTGTIQYVWITEKEPDDALPEKMHKVMKGAMKVLHIVSLTPHAQKLQT